MFGVTDINAVLSSGLPSAEAFLQITQSKAIVTFIMCWIILVYFSTSLFLLLKLERLGTDDHRSVSDKSMGYRRPDDVGLCSRCKLCSLSSSLLPNS